jgi:hypothetical protein
MINIKKSVINFSLILAIIVFCSNSISARYLMNAQKALQEDIESIVELPENAVKASGRVKNAAEDLGGSVAKNGLDLGKVGDDYNNKTAHREGLSRLTPEEMNVLRNPDDYSLTDRKAAAKKYMDGYTEVRGIDKANVHMFDDTELKKPIDEKGLPKNETIAITDGDKKKNDIFFEKDNIEKDDKFIRAIGQEAKRHDLAEKGVKNDTPDGVSTKYDKEAAANNEFAKQAFEQEQFFKGPAQENKDGSYAPVTNQQIENHNLILAEGNKGADEVKDAQPYIIKTGEVEKGDTLISITKEVNNYYGTDKDASEMAKINERSVVVKPKPGEKIQIGTVDEDGNIWKPPYEEGAVNEEYWNNLSDEQKDITHFHRRVFEDETNPNTQQSLEANEKKNWDGPNASPAHNVGKNGNVEYRGVGTKTGQQVVYDSKGQKNNTPENAGSYDYVPPPTGLVDHTLNPEKLEGHLSVDVDWWIEKGNSPQDTTTREQRIKAMAETWKGREGLKRVGYKENPKTGQWEKP